MELAEPVLDPIPVVPMPDDVPLVPPMLAGFPMVEPGAPTTVEPLPKPWPDVVPGCCTVAAGVPGLNVPVGVPVRDESPTVEPVDVPVLEVPLNVFEPAIPAALPGDILPVLVPPSPPVVGVPIEVFPVFVPPNPPVEAVPAPVVPVVVPEPFVPMAAELGTPEVPTPPTAPVDPAPVVVPEPLPETLPVVPCAQTGKPLRARAEASESAPSDDLINFLEIVIIGHCVAKLTP